MSAIEEEGRDGEASQQQFGPENAAADFERAGRFYGPESSWRSYTQIERAVAASLDQAENDNLSIHLYNAHKWKERLRRPDLDNVKPWHSKGRWISIHENGKAPWMPHDAWTAWPLKPEDVPRAGETWGIPTVNPEDDEGTFKMKVAWKPSLELQEALTADILRQAKEKFWARQAAWEQEITEEGADDGGLGDQAIDTASEFEESDASDGSIDENPQENAKTDDEGEEDILLAFTADDSAAERIVQPTVRHMIAKLQDVLVALHHSRQGHRRDHSSFRDRSSKYRSKPRSKSRSRQASPDDDEERGSDPEVCHGRRSFSNSSSNRRRLRPRDWSEVLGVAALIGAFPPEVIDRTARRCAAMFGESMGMRIMPDLMADSEQEQVVKYVPDMVPPLEELKPIARDPILATCSDAKPVEFTCPFESCDRHEIAYEKRWRLREHLKRKHGASTEDMDLLMMKTTGEPELHRQNGQDEEIQQQFPCSYHTCDRHTKPYEKRWRLREHMKRKHKVEDDI